jgi:hypothetical protein
MERRASRFHVRRLLAGLLLGIGSGAATGEVLTCSGTTYVYGDGFGTPAKPTARNATRTIRLDEKTRRVTVATFAGERTVGYEEPVDRTWLAFNVPLNLKFHDVQVVAESFYINRVDGRMGASYLTVPEPYPGGSWAAFDGRCSKARGSP